MEEETFRAFIDLSRILSKFPCHERDCDELFGRGTWKRSPRKLQGTCLRVVFRTVFT